VVPYMTVKRLAVRALLLGVVALAVVYASDYFVAQYRATHNAGAVYGSVNVYLATAMKNGQVQLFYQHPQSVKCVRSIFPQLGYEPCWYLGRSKVDLIS
jgi:hypothetical protein